MKLIYLAKIFMDLLFIIIWLFFPQLIPAGLTASCEVAKKPENKDKNRYGNIIACKSTKAKINVFRRCKSDCVCLNFIQLFGFVDISDDHSRVVLKPVHGDVHDDYTNANYIEVRGLTWIFYIRRYEVILLCINTVKMFYFYIFRATKGRKLTLRLKVRMFFEKGDISKSLAEY